MTLTGDSEWDCERQAFCLPPGFVLVMGDVCGGSNTPSMVREVLHWRRKSAECVCPDRLDLGGGGILDAFVARHGRIGDEAIWRKLGTANAAIAALLQQVAELATRDPVDYERTMLALAAQPLGRHGPDVEDSALVLAVRSVVAILSEVSSWRWPGCFFVAAAGPKEETSRLTARLPGRRGRCLGRWARAAGRLWSLPARPSWPTPPASSRASCVRASPAQVCPLLSSRRLLWRGLNVYAVHRRLRCDLRRASP